MVGQRHPEIFIKDNTHKRGTVDPAFGAATEPVWGSFPVTICLAKRNFHRIVLAYTVGGFPFRLARGAGIRNPPGNTAGGNKPDDK